MRKQSLTWRGYSCFVSNQRGLTWKSGLCRIALAEVFLDKIPAQHEGLSKSTFFLWQPSEKLLKCFILRQSKYFASIEWIASFQLQYNKGKWRFLSDQNKALGGMLPLHKNEMFLLSPSTERKQIFRSTRSTFLGCLFFFFRWNLIATDLKIWHGQGSGDLENEEGQPLLQEL